MSLSTTLWTKGPGKTPLYSDWSVSFTASSDCGFACKDEKEQNAGSVSTTSLSSEESVATDQSSSDNIEGRQQDEQTDELSDNSEDQQQGEKQKEALFSVHRNMIGPKSVFFTKSFLGEESSNSSVIALPSDLPTNTFASVVEAFELLLDYCYNGNENFVPEHKLTTENAVAMFCLCNYFEMDSEICEKVRDFIKSDLRYDTVANYYQIVKDMRSTFKRSIVLDANPIMDMVVILCHQCPIVLDSHTNLFKIADLCLWLSIGSLLANDDDENDKATSADSSRAWSENLTNFFNTYHEEDVVNLKDSFRTLTAENILPEVSSKVALRLLEYESKHGLGFLTRRAKNAKEMDDGDISRATSDVSDDGTISTTHGSDIDEVVEEELLGTSLLTNLQHRCIRALCESNWSGEENDLEQKRGKLVDITTPAVLEALLIDSVTGGRALSAKMEEMEVELAMEKKALKQEIESYEFKQEETKVEVAKANQKKHSLQRQLDEVSKECETAQRKLKKLEGKVEDNKAALCKANALLEAELDAEKKKSYSLNQRFRTMEVAQNKVETDREMFELTIKETIKQLDSITTCEETYGACGLEPLIMLISALNDRSECEQIKSMLQRVVKDPLTYERDYLLKNRTIEEDGNDIGSSDTSFLTLSKDDFS